jgi:hypothetical protein
LGVGVVVVSFGGGSALGGAITGTLAGAGTTTWATGCGSGGAAWIGGSAVAVATSGSAPQSESMFSVAGMMDMGPRRSPAAPGGSLVVLIGPPDFTVLKVAKPRNQDLSKCRKKSHPTALLPPPSLSDCVAATIV